MTVDRVCIYCRYSSSMQRASSCDDQERKAREWLTRHGIDHSEAVVVRDQAQSGTLDKRAGFQQVLELARRKKISLVIVDDMARFSRGPNAPSQIIDLTYTQVRFVSVYENIDTADPDYRTKILLAQIHNDITLSEARSRILRGQEGRVLDDGSAGDFGFGYESFYLDPDGRDKVGQRGPKPKKGVRVFEDEARWVRLVFEWFGDGWSISRIAKRLTDEGVGKGHRSATRGWHHQQVHRMLSNEKYAGRWAWRTTTTTRNSEGDKKQIAARPCDTVVRLRPDLRIVDQPVWEKAAARLASHLSRYGPKAGQKPRGPKQNPAGEYPRSALGGVLTCGVCGETMWLRHSNGKGFYACSGAVKGLCDMKTRVPADLAWQRLASLLLEIVRGWPDWMRVVYSLAKEAVREAVSKLPDDRDRDEKRLAQLRRELANMVALARAGTGGETLADEMRKSEVEVKEVEARLAADARVGENAVNMPDEVWVAARVREWASRAASQAGPDSLVRLALKSLRAEAAIARGKSRGFSRLRLRVDSWGVLVAAMADHLPEDVRNLIPDGPGGGDGPEFVIDLGKPTKMDLFGPDVARWREEGVIWKEIARRTGMRLGNLHTAWKRYIGAADERPTAE